MTKLLEEVLHEFNILHGLWATDGFHVYGEAQRAGCDSNGAWDRFREECFRIDLLSLIEKVESVLLIEGDCL